MDFDTSQKIQAQLSSGESLLWSGRPRQGVVFRGSDVFVIPFSLLWCGFAFFWIHGAYSSGAPLPFVLFGVPFVLMGLYFVFGRFIFDSLNRRSTYYGVSNDRVLIVSEFPTAKTKSLGLSTLSDITFSSKPDNSGSITFGANHAMAEMFGGMNWPGMEAYQGPKFDMIANVKSVYDTIQNAKKRQR